MFDDITRHDEITLWRRILPELPHMEDRAPCLFSLPALPPPVFTRYTIAPSAPPLRGTQTVRLAAELHSCRSAPGDIADMPPLDIRRHHRIAVVDVYDAFDADISYAGKRRHICL